MIEGSVFVVVAWTEHCTAKKPCGKWMIERARERGGCEHQKLGAYTAIKLYTKVGPARSYLTECGKPRSKYHSIEHPAYILIGGLADLVRLDADAQQRAEHFESRALVHAEEAMRLAAGPIVVLRPKRKKAA